MNSVLLALLEQLYDECETEIENLEIEIETMIIKLKAKREALRLFENLKNELD